MGSPERLGPLRSLLALLGAAFIYLLIYLFGRRVTESSIAWLLGPRLVWRISTLHEHFRLYVDDRDVLRCDHAIRFLGLRVLRLHYRMERVEHPA